ncbi:hypothetical protein [Lacimicrobium alkaliphilum]|uniref:Uncharacterized protein n=1 Tax=Lacimicrobium alkaliphilum TaxID=1526571 RepID=A0A0U2PJK3_9ALTE|nr:hypothetical protein [Lacimicrobium alkaliphilum]ALS99725.1 hypothetical protein AT746_16595 [Lacimicrobium alkaliphilum]
MPNDSITTPASAGVSSVPPEVTAELVAWWQQVRALACDQLQLLTLEGQRVANSMVALLVFGLIAGLLALTLWFGALAQIIILAQHSLLSAGQALGLAMVVNLSGLWFVLRRCRYYSSLLRFPATMQSLRLAGSELAKEAR